MSATSVQFSVAAHVMAVLGDRFGEEVTSAFLAASVNAEPSFVRKSLSKLAKAGLVVTTRGKNGRCSLARDPKQITLLDIYRASEAPAMCAVHRYCVEEACPISRNIKDSLSGILGEAQAAFELRLKRTTLAEMVAGIRKRSAQRKRYQPNRLF